jgi:hypothetical protein
MADTLRTTPACLDETWQVSLSPNETGWDATFEHRGSSESHGPLQLTPPCRQAATQGLSHSLQADHGLTLSHEMPGKTPDTYLYRLTTVSTR